MLDSVSLNMTICSYYAILGSSIHISELSAIPPTVWDRLESFLPPQICISTKEVLFSVCFVCLFVHCKSSVFAQGFVWNIWRYTCMPLDCCSLPGQDRHSNESSWLWLTLPTYSCSSNDIIHVATDDGNNHLKSSQPEWTSLFNIYEL